SDADAIPLPFTHAEMTLPFNPGDVWEVNQGTDNGWVKEPDGTLKEGSHNGISAFAWDFRIYGYPQSGVYPFGSRLAPFHAAGRGQVVELVYTTPPAGDPANDIEVQQGPNEIGTYLHF